MPRRLEDLSHSGDDDDDIAMLGEQALEIAELEPFPSTGTSPKPQIRKTVSGQWSQSLSSEKTGTHPAGKRKLATRGSITVLTPMGVGDEKTGATANFWKRVKKLFKQIEGASLKSGHITRDELMKHFGGNTSQADRYIDEMSKFAFRGKSRGDGKITLAEFEEYFDHVADQDTGDAETSPLACKVLVALEYKPTIQDQQEYSSAKSKNGKSSIDTNAAPGFWRRVDELFHAIDNGGDGDGRISRDELVKHFKGNTREADHILAKMDGMNSVDIDDGPDGFIDLEEWHGYFEEVSVQDTGVAETSPAAIKALAALEYAEAHKVAAALEPTTLVPTKSKKMKKMMPKRESSSSSANHEQKKAAAAGSKIRPATHDFWKRVTSLFYQIDGISLPDKRITREEFVAHFRGNTREADKYMDLMDGFTDESEEAPDGIITLEEFQAYFRYVAEEDTGRAETSPSAAKALLALEYSPDDADRAAYTASEPAKNAASATAAAETHRFWERAEAVFKMIDANGDGSVTRDELTSFFGGNTSEADYYIDEMDGFVGGEGEQFEDPDGVISLEEWRQFFREAAQEDTGDAKTSPAAAKALAAFERSQAVNSEKQAKQNEPAAISMPELSNGASQRSLLRNSMGQKVSKRDLLSKDSRPNVTPDFWKRVTTLFKQIGTLVNNDRRISRAELVAHFRGNTAEADKYMELIDGYTEDGEVEPNGYITLGEWQEYFRYVAEEDTRDPETSPLACKALMAFEYQPTEQDRAAYSKFEAARLSLQKSPKTSKKDLLRHLQEKDETMRFWERVDDVFHSISHTEEKSNTEVVSRDEINELFQSNSVDMDNFMSKLASIEGDDITQSQWRQCFDLVSDGDTGVAKTSPLAAKALSALEYAELNRDFGPSASTSAATSPRGSRPASPTMSIMVGRKKLQDATGKKSSPSPLAVGQPATKDFWKRVTSLFNKIDSLIVKDQVISRDELVKFLGGNESEADHYFDMIDGYTSTGEQSPNGMITLDEWQEYFRYVAEDDTGRAETSPLACKALVALEYELLPEDTQELEKHQRRNSQPSSPTGVRRKSNFDAEIFQFWKRADKLFVAVVGSSDGEITHAALKQHLRGREANAEVDYYVDQIAVFHEKGLSSASGSGLISLEEWHEFFQTLSEQDTYMPSTSQACAKALSAMEYAEKIAHFQETSPKPRKQVKTANFWPRVNKLFRKIDSVGTKDGSITKAELVTYFRGNTNAAEKYMDIMDGFTPDGEENPDGSISLEEFQEYFRYVAEEDTRNAETSPLACKALVALEYEPPAAPGVKDEGAGDEGDDDVASRKLRDETPDFWNRVDTLFNVMDTRGDGDGRISRDELLAHFGNCGPEAEFYMEVMDGFLAGEKDEDPDGSITLEEWHEYFRFASEHDTGVPETSAEACKALAALENAQRMTLEGKAEEGSRNSPTYQPTQDFWLRVEKLFSKIDGMILPDKRISAAELTEYFRGNTEEADRYMDMMNGYRQDKDETPDGFVDLDEWKEYFRWVAEDDTGVAETSPLACKALLALEYNPTAENSARYHLGKKPGEAVSLRKYDETANFWPRVEAVFNLIDLNGDGNGFVSRAELIAHFRGNTAEADYYLDEIEGRHKDDVAITMKQWRSYFMHIAEKDTGVASTSASAAKALSALEYAESVATAEAKRRQPKIVTANFWPRVDALYKDMNTLQNAQGGGQTIEADDCLAMMDGFYRREAKLTTDPRDGVLTADMFRYFFKCAAEFDTHDPETSPMAAKALAALEYAPHATHRDRKKYTATTTTETGRDASYVNELIEAAREGRRIAPSITHNFWARADLVFKFIDAKGDGDGRVSRAELRAHFKGNTEEADYYMDQMDGFEPEEKDTDPDGFITLSEWHEFFNFCAEDDTNDATTSPAAAKALAALEYAQNTGATTSAQKPQKIEVPTVNFWTRVTALFDKIDSSVAHDGCISREELRLHFQGNTSEADSYTELLDTFFANRSSDNGKPSKAAHHQQQGDTISLEEWQDFFRFISENDTGIAETSAAACKVLSALEYRPNASEADKYRSRTSPQTQQQQQQSGAASNRLEVPTFNFWARVDAVFRHIDGKGNGDGRISRDEFSDHFRGNNDEVDYHMDVMDGFIDGNADEAPDGFITAEEWHNYFEFLATKDTGNAETSPLCAKTLAAIEYADGERASDRVKGSLGILQAGSAAAAHLAQAQKNGWSAPTTTNFWMRVTALFKKIAAIDNDGDVDRISRSELAAHFHGNTNEADQYMELLDGFTFTGNSDDADGYLTLEEWHGFFHTIAEVDSGVPETSPAACKALAALEYVPTDADRENYLAEHFPGSPKAAPLSAVANVATLASAADPDSHSSTARLATLLTTPNATHAFWKRVDAVFDAIDSKGVADDKISRDELMAHFRGRALAAGSDQSESELAQEVDYYMDQMDGFVDAHTEEAADGVITRQEWRHYFDFVAEEDTNNPETSPACAKVLSALEYAEIYKRPTGAQQKKAVGDSRHLQRARSSRQAEVGSGEASQQQSANGAFFVHRRSRHRRPNPELRLLKNFQRPDEQFPPPRVPRKKKNVHHQTGGGSQSRPRGSHGADDGGGGGGGGVRIVRRRHKRKKLQRQHQGLSWGPPGDDDVGHQSSSSRGGFRGQVAI